MFGSDDEFRRLLGSARGGDRAALNELAGALRTFLRPRAEGKLSKVLLRRRDESDQVQDAVFEVCQTLSNFRGETPGEFLTWALTILERRGQRFHRDEHQECRSLSREEYGTDQYSPLANALSEHTPPVEKALRKEVEEQLQQVMQQLSPPVRQAWEWRSQGMAMVEIGLRLGCSRGKVAQLLEQARREVEKSLGPSAR